MEIEKYDLTVDSHVTLKGEIVNMEYLWTKRRNGRKKFYRIVAYGKVLKDWTKEHYDFRTKYKYLEPYLDGILPVR